MFGVSFLDGLNRLSAIPQRLYQPSAEAPFLSRTLNVVLDQRGGMEPKNGMSCWNIWSDDQTLPGKPVPYGPLETNQECMGVLCWIQHG